MTPGYPPPPGAVISPDGRYWWDGRAWEPVPPPPPAPPPAPPPSPLAGGAFAPLPPSVAPAAVPGPAAEPAGFWARHRLQVAEKHYGEQLHEWQEQVDGLREYLQLVDTFPGLDSAPGLVLKAGETVFGAVNGAGLVETRVQGGHFVSGSSGFSFPVGSIGGRSIRYRVGRTRGHFVQGAPVAAAVDRGMLAITSQRALFVGARQTRECLFAKLLGYRHDGGEITLSVSNRKQPLTVHYGTELDDWFVERFELALATYRGTRAQLHDQIQGLIGAAEQHKPASSAPYATSP